MAGVLAIVIGLPAAAAELIMIHAPNCEWCERWDEEIGPIYPLTAESKRAPLRRIDFDTLADSGLNFARPVIYTPTFILMDQAREVGRITGYPGEEFFWSLLGELMTTLPAPPPHACRQGGNTDGGPAKTAGRPIC